MKIRILCGEQRSRYIMQETSSKERLLMSVIKQLYVVAGNPVIRDNKIYIHYRNKKEYYRIGLVEPTNNPLELEDLKLTAFDTDSEGKEPQGIALYRGVDKEGNAIIYYDNSSVVLKDTQKVVYTDGQRLWLRGKDDFEATLECEGKQIKRFQLTGTYSYRTGSPFINLYR